MSIKKESIVILFFIILTFIFVIGIFLWLKPTENTAETAATPQLQILNTAQQETANVALATPSNFSSQSQQDIEINCQLDLDSNARLIINEKVKNCFEYFITQYGEKDIEQIKVDFAQYIGQNYQQPAAAQITDLWTRYLEYRQALADIQTPSATPESVAYYQSIYASMQDLRKKYFSNYEIQGLFGTENTYHEYTLKRLAILENPKLTEAEKAQKLAALFDKLPKDLKENLEQITTLDNLRKLTAELKARNASEQELQQMRLNLVGAEATARLEKLDQTRTTWKNRVTQYLNQRDQILTSNMSSDAKQQAIQMIQKQQFTTQQELLRIQTFETVHDQGGSLPFYD